MKGLQDVVNQAKALVQRLREKETAVDVTLKDVNTLSEHLTSMRQFREEVIVNSAVGKPSPVTNNNIGARQPTQIITDHNSDGENQNKDLPPQIIQKPKVTPQKHEQFVLAHQPVVLALLSENRRLAALEAENADLVKCLEEYQSALDMIMHKYRTHVTKFASTNQVLTKTIADMGQKYQAERTTTELRLLERINDMAAVMRQATELDDHYYTEVVGLVTRLHFENKCLRELLDSRVMGTSNTSKTTSSAPMSSALATSSRNFQPPTSVSTSSVSPSSQPTVSQLLLNGIIPTSSASSSSSFQSVIYQNNRASNEQSPASSVVLQNPSNGLPYRLTTGASSGRFSVPPASGSSYLSSQTTDSFKLPKRAVNLSPQNLTDSESEKSPLDIINDAMALNDDSDHAVEEEVEAADEDEDDELESVSSASTAPSVATLCPNEEAERNRDFDDEEDSTSHNEQQEIDDLVAEMMNLDATTTPADVTVVEPASS